MPTSIRFSDNIEKRLNHLAQETHRTKSFYIQRAVEDFLEDQEDYFLALAVQERIDSGEEKMYTLEEAKKMLGIKQS